ncbi:MAG: hypothetical protein IKG22_15820, partial [Atopobiaceae bacterium]|nr:hypothetical protein [Atopobiaceae bacterium]
MSSVVYAGMDLGNVCSAQVVGRSVNEFAVEAMRAAGRPGTVPVSAWMPPEDVRVRPGALIVPAPIPQHSVCRRVERWRRDCLLCAAHAREVLQPKRQEFRSVLNLEQDLLLGVYLR